MHGGLRARPEHDSRMQAVALSCDPEWNALVPPFWIFNSITVPRRKFLAWDPVIFHRVGDDAIAIRAQARDQRIVVRKGQGRE